MKTDNEYFAEYLGWKLCLADACIKVPHYFNDDGLTQYVKDLNFKTWAALMPVVEKICQHTYKTTSEQDGKIITYRANPTTFGMMDEDANFLVRFRWRSLHHADTLLDATYLAALDFIKGLEN